MIESEIKEIIRSALPDAEVSIQDLNGLGNHLRLEVASVEFRGLSRIACHKKVQDLFESQLADGSLHALSLKTIEK